MLTARGRALTLLGLALTLTACAAPGGSPQADRVPRAVCLDEPRRGERADPARPLVFLLCVQTP
ncbi:MAG TPA: hypothetical protein VNK50_07540 [Calidithermus sp.]|nr:hypothetical protein [Calidithermus sp.]